MLNKLNEEYKTDFSETYRKLRKIFNFEVLLAFYMVCALALGFYVQVFHAP